MRYVGTSIVLEVDYLSLPVLMFCEISDVLAKAS